MALVVAAPAFAGRRGDAVDALRDAPSASQLIVSIDGASEFADGTIGKLILTILKQGSPELPRAWGELAEELELTERAAFDRLFGRRAMIAARPNEDDTWSWVVRSFVDDATARMLRKSMAEAPRKLAQGRQVLAAEGGQFELIVIDHKEGRSELLFGPASSPDLLDAAALQRPRAGGALRRVDDRDREIARLPRGARIFIYSELDDSMAPDLLQAHPELETWSALAATPDEDGHLQFTFVTMLERHPERLPAVKPWSRETFDAFAHGAIAAVIESDVMSRELWPTMEERFLKWLGKPLNPINHEAVRGRIAFGLYPSPTGPVDVVFGFESPDVSELAPSADGFVASIVGLMPTMGEASDYDFGGLAPEALREVDLRPAIGNLALMGWPDVGPTLAWRYPRSPEGEDRGWMTVGLGQELVRHASDALVAPAGGDRQAWLSLGMIRPCAFIEVVQGLPIAVPRWLDGFKQIESVSWQVSAGPRGAMIGRGELRLSAGAACGHP